MGYSSWWRCHGRAVLLCASVALVLGSGPAPAQDDPPPPTPEELLAPAIKTLEKTAPKLARKKQMATVDELLAVLLALGDPQVRVDKLRERCERTDKLAKKVKEDMSKEAAVVREVATDISALLPQIDEPRRSELAQLVLDIDDTNAAAHAALGSTLYHGAWIGTDLVPVFERRAQIEDAIRMARAMEVPMTVEESKAAPLLDVFGKPGWTVRWRTVSLHSGSVGPVRLKRILGEAVRAYALAHWIRTGRLHAPPTQPLHRVYFASREHHLKALDAAVAKKTIKPGREEAVRRVLTNWLDTRGYNVSCNYFEPAFQTPLFRDLWMLQFNAEHRAWADDDIQPCLLLGHMNWVAERYLGSRIPGWDWSEAVERERGRTSDRPSREEERLLRVARTGIAGVRAYLKYKARRGEDPAWTRSFVNHAGELAGEDMLKSMLVVEYLQECGDFRSVLLTTLKQPASQELFEKALGQPMLEFEADWRRWLLAGEPTECLLERMGGAAGDDDDEGQPPVVKYLNKLRRQAIRKSYEKVLIEPSLAEGCENHARYLAKHPDQRSSWPGAHEEYPDREGFTPAGVRAGSRSVIAPGCKDHTEAIDGWMATYYHRLPLLDPGLLRVGWGLEERIAVLDTGSMVEQTVRPMLVVWPPKGGKGIGRRFQLEAPSPLPGADQSKWGYPVTVQVFGKYEGVNELVVTLHEGDADGPVVPCIVSTPQEPSNPVLAPAGAWCLIPKAHLEPKTRYTTVIQGLPEKPKQPSAWSFTTGD